MIVMGIDPGQTGGLAWVTEDLTKLHFDGAVGLVDAISMPLIKLTKKPTLDLLEVHCWFDHLEYADEQWAVVIENVHAMPAQGVSSSFQFGRMFGAVEVMAQTYSQKIIYVTPQKWKRHFGLLKTNKSASVAKATELYGDEHWKLKKHEGVAEAALIATWGLHQLTKE